MKWRCKNFMYIILFIGLIISIAVFCFFRYKRVKDEKREHKQMEYIDIMTTKPAEINIKYIEPMVNDVIKSYVAALYNLNPNFLPLKNMTEVLYEKTYKSMKREYDIGVRKMLVQYKPLKRYKIRQNNSSIYAVQELNTEAEYNIEFLQYHSTFKKKDNIKIKQIFTFSQYNNGWFLSAVGEMKIISKEETDLE